MNADEFDTYVIKKGYEFYQMYPKTDVLVSGIAYTNNINSTYITKYVYAYRGVRVSFQTGNSKTYLNAKNELKVLGFTLNDSGSRNGWNYFNYRKEGLEVVLITGQVENKGSNTSSTGYEITVGDAN